MTDVFESLFTGGDEEFRKAQKGANSDSQKREALFMYRLLMTLANSHAVVSDAYFLQGNMSLAGHHRDRVNKYRQDAMKAKQMA